MVKIRFETGQTVNFEGNPTQADIEEVARSFKPVQKTPEQSKQEAILALNKPASDFTKGLGNFAGTTLSTLGEAGVGLAQGAVGLATKASDKLGLRTDDLNKISGGLESYKQKAFTKPVEQARTTLPGKAGTLTGTLLPYMVSPASYGANVLKDTLVGYGQSGGNKKAALSSGIITAVTGPLSKIPVVKNAGNKIITKTINALTAVAPGYASDVVTNITQGKQGFDIVKPGIGTYTVGAIKSLPTMANAVSKLKPNPSTIMQRVARVPKGQQVKFKQMTGEDIGDYLIKKGDYGTPEQIIEKNYNRFTEAKNLADNELAKLPGQFKNKALGTALDDLAQRESVVSTPGALSQDFDRVAQLKTKHDTIGLTMSEVNEAKRLYEKNVKLGYLRENKVADVDRATNIDTAIRNFQLEQADKLGLKNLKEINKETQAARFIADSLSKQYAGQAGNNAVSLTDWVAISGGDPASAIPLYLTKKFFGSKRVQSKIAKTFAPKPEAPLSAKYGGVTGLPARVEGVNYDRQPVRNVSIDKNTNKSIAGFNLPQNVRKYDLGIDEKVPIQTTPLVQQSQSTKQLVSLPKSIPQTKLPSTAKTSINKHIGTAFQVLNDPDMAVEIAKNQKAFITQTKNDIVMGLKADGFTKEAQKLSTIDVSKVNSIGDLTGQIEKKLNQKAGFVESIVNKFNSTPNKQGGFAKNPLFKESDVLTEKVSQAINDIDTNPVKVNGKLEFGNTNDIFELDKAKARINTGKPLTVPEAEYYAPILKRNGIDVYAELDNAMPPKKTVNTPLYKEAQKYKSAEEFVNKQEPVYHGSDYQLYELENKPIFTTPDKKTAESFGDEVNNLYVNPNKKVKVLDLESQSGKQEINKLFNEIKSETEIKMKDLNVSKQDSERYRYNSMLGEKEKGSDFMQNLYKYTEFEDMNKAIDTFMSDKFVNRNAVYKNWDKIFAFAKKNGYDVIKHTTESSNKAWVAPETIYLNPKDTLVTKPQLEQIWKEANTKKTSLPKKK